MSLPSSPTRATSESEIVTQVDISTNTVTSLLIEMLQVAIEQVWYTRGVYPKESFQKRRCFDLEVWTNIHPGVRHYLEEAAMEILAKIKKGRLKRLFIDIYQENAKIESYAFSFTGSILFDYLREGCPVNLDSSFDQGLLYASLQSLLFSLLTELSKLPELNDPPDFKLLISSDDSLVDDPGWVLETTDLTESGHLADITVHTLHEVNLGYLSVKGYTSTR